jgi:hypothetical protein
MGTAVLGHTRRNSHREALCLDDALPLVPKHLRNRSLHMDLSGIE